MTSSPGGDRISLVGLRGFGRHGVHDFERRDGQEFVVDVDLWVDLARAGATDDLADTVDYGSLASDIVAIVEGEPVALIETLATLVADRCLADSRVHEVRVVVHKPQAPVAVAFGDVTVTIHRTGDRTDHRTGQHTGHRARRTTESGRSTT